MTEATKRTPPSKLKTNHFNQNSQSYVQRQRRNSALKASLLEQNRGRNQHGPDDDERIRTPHRTAPRRNLYQIKRGNNGVSLDLANRIVAKFSEVSKLWLLTGDGPMLIEKTEPARLTPWAYFAGTALHALIAKDVDYPEKSAAHYADRMVELYAKRGGRQ